jgi:uncharacterized protein YbjT (DUF2867 family)
MPAWSRGDPELWGGSRNRRPGSQAAARLHLLGADIYAADSMSGAVQRAAEGADAFFLMATPFEEGVEAEVRQGQQAAKAAKEAGIKHHLRLGRRSRP